MAFFIYKIYYETGIFTSVSIGLIFIAIESICLYIKDLNLNTFFIAKKLINR